MAGLLATPRRRGSGFHGDDNLLGISGEIGMTDEMFRRLGRAPVDEFFAGRNSAAIRDGVFKSLEAKADRARLEAEKETSSFSARNEGGIADKMIRESVYKKAGMHMYPGHAVGQNADKPTYMLEYPDTDAQLKEGWRNAKTLGGLLDHPVLYEHYPEMKKMPVIFNEDDRYNGYFGGVSDRQRMGEMGINPNRDDISILSTALHEAQHYIQRLEGWGPGGMSKSDSPQDMEDYLNIDGEILARAVQQRYVDDRLSKFLDGSPSYEEAGPLVSHPEDRRASRPSSLPRGARQNYEDSLLMGRMLAHRIYGDGPKDKDATTGRLQSIFREQDRLKGLLGL